MYKHLTVFLCRFMLSGMMFTPSVSVAAGPLMPIAEDSCTGSNDHTIDKRCYVTDEQKRTKPYNAVVALYDDERGIYCTGTMLGIGGRLLVNTAKHCVADKDGNVAPTITVMTQTGKKLTVDLIQTTDHDAADLGPDRSDDWAYYIVPLQEAFSLARTSLTEHGPSNKIVPHSGNKYVPHSGSSYSASVVGYGALKIMSDTEINLFKQKYIKYLKYQHGVSSNGTEPQYGWYDGGLYVFGTYGNSFLWYLYKNQRSYYNDIFRNKRLKVSKCVFRWTGIPYGCQIWGGNSGGGVFDSDGGLMGVLTGYDGIVGGKSHSSASGAETGIKNVTFFK